MKLATKLFSVGKINYFDLFWILFALYNFVMPFCQNSYIFRCQLESELTDLNRKEHRI